MEQLKLKINENTVSLRTILEEKYELEKAFFEETRKLTKRLDERTKQLDERTKQLDEREALIHHERQKLEEDRAKCNSRNNTFQMVLDAYRKAHENISRLVEEQMKEVEEALRKKLELLGADDWEAVEWKFEELEEKLEAKDEEFEDLEREEEGALRKELEILGGDDREASVEKKIKELEEKLEAKDKELKDLEARYNKLVVTREIQCNMKLQGKLEAKDKELKDLEARYNILVAREIECNKELQEARKFLLQKFDGVQSTSRRANIGIIRFGEIDNKAFKNVCKLRFSRLEADTKALEACSFWQKNVKNAAWHPFEVIEDGKGGNPKEVLKEDDELLVVLKKEWGNKVYDSVTKALKERNEHNPSGGCAFSELWNFKKDRKASMKEGIHYTFRKFKSLKRKR